MRRQILILTTFILLGSMFLAGATHSWFYDDGAAAADFTSDRVLYAAIGHAATGSGMILEDINVIDDPDNPGSTIAAITTRESISFIYMRNEILRPLPDTNERILRLVNHSTIDTNARLGISATIATGEAIDEMSWERTADAPDGGVVWLCGRYIDEDVDPIFVPLFKMEFAPQDPAVNNWALITPAAMLHPSMGAIQWDLAPGGNLVLPPPADPEIGDSFDVIRSIRLIDEIPPGVDEMVYKDLYSRHDLFLRVAYYARQDEAMAWADWPANYEVEATYLRWQW